MAVTTYTPDNLDTAVLPGVTIDVTVLSGQVLVRGQAVAVSAGKVSELLTTGDFYGVMNEDIDATAGDTVGSMYYGAAALLKSELVFTTGDAAEFQEAARSLGIYFVEGV